MLPIYLCEDDKIQLEALSKEICNIIMMEDLDMELRCAASSPELLLSVLSSAPAPSVYFLDVELNADMNGFQLAEKIRQYDPRGFIIFITTHSELSFLAFEYQAEALDYIIKDDITLRNDRIRHALKKATQLYTTKSNILLPVIALKIGSHVYTLIADDIYGIETMADNGHILLIETKTGYIEYTETLKNILTILPSNFFLCHKSCIINLDYTASVNTKEHTVLLTNQSKYPVSYRQMPNLLRTLKGHTKKLYLP